MVNWWFISLGGDFVRNIFQPSNFEYLIVFWEFINFKNYSFTKEAGLPFYPDTSKRYFLFEMHYDNPQLMSDIVDDSGVKLYFTQKELRPNDLGLVKLTDDLPIGKLQLDISK